MDNDPDIQSPMLHNPKTTLSNEGHKLNQYVAAIAVSLGALCAGTCLSWTSPVLAQLSLANKNENSTENFYLSGKEDAAVGGMIAIGALVSAIPTGLLIEKFGRKLVIIAASISFLINWILIVFAENSATLIIGRFFAGLGTGAICVAGPIYIHEISETSIKGTLASFINMFLCVGILFTSIIGSFTSWRQLSMILAVIPGIFGLAFTFMPESPMYLIKKNLIKNAEKNLLNLRGPNYNVQAELKTMQQEIEFSQQQSASLKDIFLSKANRRAFIAVVGVLAFQQLCGINVVVFYTVPIFKAAGSNISPDLAGILVALVQVLVTAISVFIIEKANRKFYLLFSSVGMMLFMTALGMYFHLKKLNIDISLLNFLPIGSAVMFMVCFSIGYGPVPWLLMGELFAPEIKGIGNGFAIATNWTCAFLVAYLFPIISSTIGAYVAFYICAIIMGIATVYVALLVPETRGSTSLEMQERLNQ